MSFARSCFRITYSPTANIYRLFAERQTESNENTVVVGVPDARTPFIMDEIESICSVLTPKSESLRQAMLRLRAERPHPYYWAPFVLIGHPN